MKKINANSSMSVINGNSIVHSFRKDKVRFFKLLFERCLSTASAATQLGIHVCIAQKWAKQYEKDPEGIFEKQAKTDRPRILHDKPKSTILESIDENPSIVLDKVMKNLK
ncbi:hypothetical protein CLU79DRAFT_718742 [Phycomyces nitens]|nr:hypothetical protein CLU79DRAFT_718742 [Phycomyces nitens]